MSYNISALYQLPLSYHRVISLRQCESWNEWNQGITERFDVGRLSLHPVVSQLFHIFVWIFTLANVGQPSGHHKKITFSFRYAPKNNKLNLEMVCSIFKLVRAYYGKLRQMRKMMDGKKVGQRLMAVLVVQAWLLSSACCFAALLLAAALLPPQCNVFQTTARIPKTFPVLECYEKRKNPWMELLVIRKWTYADKAACLLDGSAACPFAESEQITTKPNKQKQKNNAG